MSYLFATLRLIALLLVVLALMFLGADAISSLEDGGRIVVRSVQDVWALFSQPALEGFKAWASHSLPGPLPQWAGGLLALPAWAATGVPGIVLAFLFGRRVHDMPVQ